MYIYIVLSGDIDPARVNSPCQDGENFVIRRGMGMHYPVGNSQFLFLAVIGQQVEELNISQHG
jgi:hypothetical protein